MLLYLTASIFIHVWVSIILSHTRDRGCTNLLEQHKPCIAMAWFNIMYLMIETTGVACISHNYSCQTHTFLHRLPSQVFTQNLSKCITWNPESIEEDENRTTSNFLPKTRATGFWRIFVDPHLTNGNKGRKKEEPWNRKRPMDVNYVM